MSKPQVGSEGGNTKGQSKLKKFIEVIFGRRMRTDEAKQERVGWWQGVPILGLDALGSASYGPEAALTILIPLGMSGLPYMRGIVAVILLLLCTLYFSYRQTIAAYPKGGGSYTVARQNLGKMCGLVAASSLLLDYMLNVAVGISAGIGALESAIPALQNHTLMLCLAVLAVITVVNLRGVRDTGLAWTIPTYGFVVTLFIVLGIGVWKTLESGGHPAPLAPPPAVKAALMPVSAWLLLRAFASGCTAMTGVEAVSNAVPIFADPVVRNARRTLTAICAALGILLSGIGYLVGAYHVGALPQDQPGYQSVISQLTAAIAGRGVVYYVVIFCALSVLTLSANTSFSAFPRLCRLLAEDRYLPGNFANLGRRLVYSHGIIVLAIFSMILLIAFGGITDRLIPLFAVGAFGAFTMSQAGMVMHWRKQGKGLYSPSLIINALGAFTTGAASIIIIVAKFVEGAWISLIIIPGLVALFAGVRRHYGALARETKAPLKIRTDYSGSMQVLAPMDSWNQMSERAIRFALRVSEDVTVLHVTDCDEERARFVTAWKKHVEEPAGEARPAVPKLQVIESPYRSLFDPIVSFINERLREDPDRVIAVVIPELVRPTWWEYLLHNQVATALKTAILMHGDQRVVVISTPWSTKTGNGN